MAAIITSVASLLGIAIPSIVSIITTIKTADGRSIDLILQDNKGIAQSIIDQANAWEASHPSK